MPAAESSDPEAFVTALVERWRADRRSGVSEVYHRYARRLLEIVRARMSDSVRGSFEPADVVQNVFGSLLCVAPPSGISRESELLAYLATSAKNELKDLHRYGTRQRRDLRLEGRLEDLPGFEVSLQSANPTPSEVAMGNEAHERFIRTLTELPTMQREVYVEARLIGSTSAEGAQRLGLPSPEAFRQVLARAVAKLTLALDVPNESCRGVTGRGG